MSARGFRSVVHGGDVAGAALGCYLVSLRVASERAAAGEMSRPRSSSPSATSACCRPKSARAGGSPSSSAGTSRCSACRRRPPTSSSKAASSWPRWRKPERRSTSRRRWCWPRRRSTTRAGREDQRRRQRPTQALAAAPAGQRHDAAGEPRSAAPSPSRAGRRAAEPGRRPSRAGRRRRKPRRKPREACQNRDGRPARALADRQAVGQGAPSRSRPAGRIPRNTQGLRPGPMNAPTPALVARPERLRLVGQRRQMLAVMHQRLMLGMLVYGGIIALIVLRILWLAAFGDHAGRKVGVTSAGARARRHRRPRRPSAGADDRCLDHRAPPERR